VVLACGLPRGTDVVDFFAFAAQFVEVFCETHVRFHGHARALLEFVRNDDTDGVLLRTFRNFFNFIDPLKRTGEFDTMGHKLQIES
jgi:hypothetical protein